MGDIMVTKSDYIRARVEPVLKKDVDSILKKLGVTTTQVITMLYKKIKRDKRVPFDVSLPNKETIKAIKEAKKGKGVVVCRNAKDMFKKLGI